MMKSVVKRKWNIIFLLFSTWGGGHLGLCIAPPNRLGGGGERREGEHSQSWRWPLIHEQPPVLRNSVFVVARTKARRSPVFSCVEIRQKSVWHWWHNSNVFSLSTSLQTVVLFYVL